MEESIKVLGLECVDSSELQLIRGGTAAAVNYKELLKLISFLADFIGEYGEDFIKGFRKGWNMF